MKVKPVALAVAMALSGAAHVQAGEIEFAPVPFPATDAQKRAVQASDYAIVDGKKVDIGYNVIMRSGDQPGSGRNGGVFGQIFDVYGEKIYDNGVPRIGANNDFASLVRGKNSQLYMVSHFEGRPGAVYLTELRQDKKTGELTPKRTRALDFSGVNGGWVHCAGSVTPWGNHLGSEEYEPDALQWTLGEVDGYNAGMAQYFSPAATDLAAESLKVVNPYDYGFAVEVEVKNFNHATVAKRYSMGRVAMELAYVMPDERTAYISDDGTYTGLFRFVADEAGNLGAGNLYVATWNQTSGEGPGAADLDWVHLGHASDGEIQAYIEAGVKFEDIFEYATPDGSGECPAGLDKVTAGHSGRKVECLAVKDGMAQAAAFLETRRFAALSGGTTEFEKMEGITHDPESNTMYLAMSRVRSGMSDSEGDIQVGYNYCGTVYALPLDGDYVARSMHGEVVGIPRSVANGSASDNFDAIHTASVNGCDVNGISEPDNVTFMPGYGMLIIGEDTGNRGHQNDAIWAYNVQDKSLTRIETTPYGSETTSPYFYPDINGFAYLMSVIQHPYGESDGDKLLDPADARGYTGYIGPFPAMD